jgi:hypothetical protein
MNGAAVIADAVTLLSNTWGRKSADGSVAGGLPDDDLGYSTLSWAAAQRSGARRPVAPLHALTGAWHEAHWVDSGHVIDLDPQMSMVMAWMQRVAPVD